MWLFYYGVWHTSMPNPDDIFFIVAVVVGAVVAYRRDEQSRGLILPFLYPMVGFLYILVLYREYGMEWLFWLLMVVALSDVRSIYSWKEYWRETIF